MAYKSKYTGLQIDDILDSVGAKQSKIDDLESIRAGAQKGATALQSEKYTGTVTGIKINGETKSGSGIIDLGTISTDISGKQDKLVDGVNIATINGQSLTEGGNITTAKIENVGDTPCLENAAAICNPINGMVYGLPGSEATGDSDDYLLSAGTVKTINGQPIVGSGDITISSGNAEANVQAVTYNFDDWLNESTKRSCRDAVDLTTGEKIYFTGHADYIQYDGGLLLDYIDDKVNQTRIIKWDVESGSEVNVSNEILHWVFTQEGILVLNGGVATLVYDEDSGEPCIQSAIVKDGVIIATKVFSPAFGSMNEGVTIDSYPISGGGSSEANIQAVDTGDVLDDVTVNYATKAYVDGLVGDINSTIGDINSILESIIGGETLNSIFPITLIVGDNGKSAIDLFNYVAQNQNSGLYSFKENEIVKYNSTIIPYFYYSGATIINYPFDDGTILLVNQSGMVMLDYGASN